MSRSFCTIIFLALFAAIGAGAEGDAASADAREKSLPAWYRWEEYKNELPDNKRAMEWLERRDAILQSPDGIKEALHLNGWKVGSIVKSSGFTFTFFGFPQEWEKSLYMYDGKLLFNQPDGSLTLMELETGKIIARSRAFFSPSNYKGKVFENVTRRKSAEIWSQCGKIGTSGFRRDGATRKT